MNAPFLLEKLLRTRDGTKLRAQNLYKYPQEFLS
jgi:hypothetical protein